MSYGNVMEELEQGEPIKAVISSAAGVVGVLNVYNTSAKDNKGVAYGICNGAVATVLTATDRFMPGCIIVNVHATYTSVVNNGTMASPNWIALSV